MILALEQAVDGQLDSAPLEQDVNGVATLIACRPSMEGEHTEPFPKKLLSQEFLSDAPFLESCGVPWS